MSLASAELVQIKWHLRCSALSIVSTAGAKATAPAARGTCAQAEVEVLH